jgi:hypothetical protein
MQEETGAAWKALERSCRLVDEILDAVEKAPTAEPGAIVRESTTRFSPPRTAAPTDVFARSANSPAARTGTTPSS